MIIFEADDPLVLTGIYDREGYKPGERKRIEKAKRRAAEAERRAENAKADQDVRVT